MPRRKEFSSSFRPALYDEHLSDTPSHDAEVPRQMPRRDSGDSEGDRGLGSKENELELPYVRRRNQARRADYPGSNAQILAGYIVLHHVECNRRKTHRKHEEDCVYFDHPRLFKGDSKLSALRGKMRINNVAEFLDENEDLGFLVNKRFQCEEYQKEMDPLFEPLPRPRDPRVPESIEPYFFSLRRNGDLAIPFSETITILSEALKEAIIAVTGMKYEHVSDLEKPSNMKMLQHLLYHYHREKEERAIHVPKVQRRLLDAFLDYIRWSYGQDYEEADDILSQGLITQAHLAKLCAPKEIMVSDVNTHPRAYMLDRAPKNAETPLVLELWSWDFEDGVFRQKWTEIKLGWPSSAAAEEKIPITSLDVYPLRYAAPSVGKRLKTRGELFWRCRKQRLVAYDPPDSLLGVQMTVPRYMVDVKTYWVMHSESDTVSSGHALDPDTMNKVNPPNDPFLLLLPHEIRGFAFNDKKWMERILDIDWNEEAFDRLVMQHHKKELIKALVTVHSTSARSTDIIEGKGNALIILLHGGPGTGKTLTAESVAELTRKPLYRVTCGDIGTNAEEVEKYLQSVLLLGTIWGCVVLLDEADVFLEERRETDLQRNALVSVFLRVLEYYHGILILTSNRIGTFDSAFKSRFQLAIHYPTLNVTGRREIWRNFIKGLSKTLPDVNIDGLMGRIDDLSQVNLNGRQIRNTVQTALQLADFRKETLDYRHFERVIKVVEEFEKHIDTTRGYTELDWVHHQGIRPES